MWRYLNLFNLQGHCWLRMVLVLEILILSGVWIFLQIHGLGFDMYDILTVLIGLGMEYGVMTGVYFSFNLLYLWWVHWR